MTMFLVMLVRFLVIGLWLVLLGRVLLGWIDPRYQSTVGRFVYSATEPVLAPIRRLLPQTGMFDLSPIVAFLVLAALLRIIV
jgi:YggT family protein